MNDFFEGLNPVEHWIKYDKKLSATLLEIENLELDLSKQAEIAFHRIAEEYNLPKMPQNIDYDVHDEEMKSVYEILGLVNYILPEEDPRGNVMFALCCIYYNLEPELEKFWRKIKEEGINKDDILGIGYFGDNYNVKIIFVKKNESWSDLGCKFFVKFE